MRKWPSAQSTTTCREQAKCPIDKKWSGNRPSAQSTRSGRGTGQALNQQKFRD
ncbi:MAG: hypothetical protein RBU37_10790 [Myxococcota bacterium]|nr:hypothetical protein [Myxococcota bacterium]